MPDFSLIDVRFSLKKSGLLLFWLSPVVLSFLSPFALSGNYLYKRPRVDLYLVLEKPVLPNRSEKNNNISIKAVAVYRRAVKFIV